MGEFRCSIHAKDRAFERYGVSSPNRAWRTAFLDITDCVLGLAQRAMLLRRDPVTGVESWLVRVDGEPLIAVYKPEDAIIIRVLPYEPKMSRFI
jgi:hypothetical protein